MPKTAKLDPQKPTPTVQPPYRNGPLKGEAARRGTRRDGGGSKSPLRVRPGKLYLPPMPLHLIKLGVGVEDVEHLERVWAGRGQRTVYTRQSPRRAAELLDGGSLYWVIRGLVACRQAIVEIRTVEEGAATRCEVELALPVVRVALQPRRPFQGWRYLPHGEVPADAGAAGEADALPPDLALRLRAIGAW